MKKSRTVVGIVFALLGALALSASALQGIAGGQDAFDYTPRGDFVLSVGATALIPGFTFTTKVDATFHAGPFYTDNVLDVVLAPAFSADDRLETGLEFGWWSAAVDVDVSVVPWSLTSTGGWLDLHPPTWVIADTPMITMDGSVGWGPQWVPLQGWTHALGGSLDLESIWTIPTVWSTDLEIIVGSDADATWTFPAGTLVGDWSLHTTMQSVLPVFQEGPSALRGGVHAQVTILPAWGVGVDVELEFRRNAFYGYAMAAAEEDGVRAEIGVRLDFEIGGFRR